MPEDNDPTKKYLEAVERYQANLFKLWKVTFKKAASSLKALIGFLKNVTKAAAQLAATVGKKVVDRVLAAGQYVEEMVSKIPLVVKAALRLGKKIIQLIRKAVDPNKIIGTLKKLFVRYVKMLREIFGYIQEMAKQLDVLGTVLMVINSFKRVLQVMLSWIADVTRANDAVVKVKRMLKKVIKEMRRELKEAEKMRKEVVRLKPAA